MAAYNALMNKIDLAYLAGVLDSDGSFSIAINRRQKFQGNRNPSYQEIVAIGQCDTQAIQLAKELFGGHTRHDESRGENRRPMHYWYVSSKIASRACVALLPYLRIKKRQAEIILELRAIKDRGRKANTYLSEPRMAKGRYGIHPRRFAKTRPEVIEEMHALAVKIRELNDTRHAL